MASGSESRRGGSRIKGSTKAKGRVSKNVGAWVSKNAGAWNSSMSIPF